MIGIKKESVRSYFWKSIARVEETFEFFVLDFAGAVLINFFNELLDIDGHLELVLDDVNQFLRIHIASALGLAT